MIDTLPPAFDAAAHAAALLRLDPAPAPEGATLVLLAQRLCPFRDLPQRFTLTRTGTGPFPAAAETDLGRLVTAAEPGRTGTDPLTGYHLAHQVAGADRFELTLLAPVPPETMWAVLTEYARRHAAADYPTPRPVRDLLREHDSVLSARLLGVLDAQGAVRTAAFEADRARVRLANAEVLVAEALPQPGRAGAADLAGADDVTFLRMVRAAAHLHPEASLTGALFRFLRKDPGFDAALATFWARSSMHPGVVEALWSAHRFGPEHLGLVPLSPVEDLVAFARTPRDVLAGRAGVDLPNPLEAALSVAGELLAQLHQLAATDLDPGTQAQDELAALALRALTDGDAATAAERLRALPAHWKALLGHVELPDPAQTAAVYRTYVAALRRLSRPAAGD